MAKTRTHDDDRDGMRPLLHHPRSNNRRSTGVFSRFGSRVRSAATRFRNRISAIRRFSTTWSGFSGGPTLFPLMTAFGIPKGLLQKLC